MLDMCTVHREYGPCRNPFLLSVVVPRGRGEDVRGWTDFETGRPVGASPVEPLGDRRRTFRFRWRTGRGPRRLSVSVTFRSNCSQVCSS